MRQSNTLFGFFIVLFLLVWAGDQSAWGQQPDYTRNRSPAMNVTYGWGSGICRKVQMLYTPADFKPDIPSGFIAELYFMYGSNSGVGAITKYKNIEIRMGQVEDTQFPSGAFYTNLTTVLKENNYEIPAGVAGDWFVVPLTNKFTYDNTKSLVVEIAFDTFTNALNGAGPACYTGIRQNGRKLWAENPSSAQGGDDPGLLNMGINFSAPLCSSSILTNFVTTANSNTVVCGNTAELSLDSLPETYGLSYQWQYNNLGTWVNFGTNSPRQVSDPLLKNMEFRCVVSCSQGGQGIATPIEVKTSPFDVYLGKDTPICDGQTLNLKSGVANATYLWSNGAATPDLPVTAAGSYWVKVTRSNGCWGTDTIQVRSGLQPVNQLAAQIDLCEGDTIDLDAGNLGCTFLWENGNQTAQAIKASEGGIYSVRITSADGCAIVSKTEVEMRPLPEATLKTEQILCAGDTLILSAGNPGCRFLWSTSDTTGSILVTEPGSYRVDVLTVYGCLLVQKAVVRQLSSPYIKNIEAIHQEEVGAVMFTMIDPDNYDRLEWDFGDGGRSTEFKPLHNYRASGTYIVKLTLFNACGEYSYTTAIRVEGVGIENPVKEDQLIRLYPNPARTIVYLSVPAGWPVQKLSISDILGKTVLDRAIGSGLTDTSVDISRLTPGLYTVKISTGSGVYTRKFQVF